MGSINTISNTYTQSLLNDLQQTASTTNTATSGANSLAASSVGLSSDNSQLSPLAQVLSTLQQLQQSDPTEYQQLTGQISTNLKAAAQTATSNGNTSEANQLNQLATDFSNASQSGQLPNVQDLAQSIGGGHHGHHHHSDASSSDSSSTSSSSSSSSSTQTQSQATSSLFGNTTQNNPVDALSVIQNTLANAGVETGS
jgi:hypothetical protein